MNEPIQNLWRVYKQATEFDFTIALGSYRKYHKLCEGIGSKHGFAAPIAAAVFAALSPNNDYYGNLRDADTLLAAVRAKKTIDQFKVSTYGNNKRKAWGIACGIVEPLQAIQAKKTRNFYLNILDPADREPVTIDGHMLNMWAGQRVSLVGLRSNAKLYDTVADAVRQMALRLNLIPNQVQGVLWTTWRRIHGIQTSPQFEFWDREYLAAKVNPFHLNEKITIQRPAPSGIAA